MPYHAEPTRLSPEHRRLLNALPADGRPVLFVDLCATLDRARPAVRGMLAELVTKRLAERSDGSVWRVSAVS